MESKWNYLIFIQCDAQNACWYVFLIESEVNILYINFLKLFFCNAKLHLPLIFGCYLLRAKWCGTNIHVHVQLSFGRTKMHMVQQKAFICLRCIKKEKTNRKHLFLFPCLWNWNFHGINRNTAETFICFV